MPGARCTRSLVCSVESTRVVTTVAPEHPAFPHAMVLTAYVVLDLIWGARERKCFCKQGWTGKLPNSPSGKSVL